MAKHQHRKRFGQHFLTDPIVINEIIELVEIEPNSTLIEIGPGLGVLTAPLLERCDKLIGIEIDRDLAAHLRQRFAGQSSFKLIETDALTLQLSEIVQGPVSIVGNLPYNISSPLLFHLFSQRGQIESMLFMLQKEVVQRMCATPGTKNYGRLSVMTQYYCDLEPLLEIPPSAFDPPPKVNSQMVRLTPRIDTLAATRGNQQRERQLSRVVTAAFAHRRKTLRNTLAPLCSAAAIVTAGCDPAARAETLSLEQFIGLAEAVAGADEADADSRV